MRQVRALLLAVALAATACSSNTEAASEVESTTTTDAPPPSTEQVAVDGGAVDGDKQDEATDSMIDFTSCGGASECAMVEVPLDYSEPDGEMVQIHVTRHTASGDRIGSLFLNPGGPGGSVELMVDGMGQWGPPGVTERFDLIGIDPRGTGKSGLADCNSDWLDDSVTYPTEDDGFADDVDTFIADFSEMAAECEAELGIAFLASLTTENAARDMETVRVALGDEPLNFLGYSYGTAIGSVYATLFPDAIRSMVLDGAVPTDPAESDTAAYGARFEEALVRLDIACDLWSACPVADVGLLNAIDQVRDELEANGEIGPLQPHTFERAVGSMIAIAPIMQEIAQGLAFAIDGDGEMLHAIGSGFLTPIPSGGFEEFSAANPAIICADGWQMAAGTADEVLAQVEETAAANPNIGPGSDVPCDLWPVFGEGIAPVNYTGSTPILVVGNTHDAFTPLESGVALVDELGVNATLLTWEGSDHTVVFGGADLCIDDHVIAYLYDGVMPADGTVCPMRGLVGVGYDDDGPVVINRITPGSPAEESGLLLGDVILRVDGIDIEIGSDWPDGPPGTEIEVLLEREGDAVEITMTRGFPVWELWRSVE